MGKRRHDSHSPDGSKELVQQQALAWAEFLYDEYMLEKHKQLLLDSQHSKIQVDKPGGDGNNT